MLSDPETQAVNRAFEEDDVVGEWDEKKAEDHRKKVAEKREANQQDEPASVWDD